MKNLMKIEKDLLFLCKTVEYSSIKGYIREVYQYNSVSDKKVYKKLIKLALKVLSEKDLISYFGDYMIDKIDNAWKEPVNKSLNFEDLSLELIKILSKYEV